MKPTYSRRIRRRSAASKENSPFKREAGPEQTFFGAPSHEPFFGPQPAIMRKCEKCEEEEKAKTVAGGKEDKVMRKGEKKEEEEKKVQTKAEGRAATATFTSGFIQAISGGHPLPAKTTAFFSRRMGYDFSSVKIHNGTEAAQSAKELHAQAYTIGNDIVFNENRYHPETEEGKKLLAHELVHVVQQEKEHIAKKDEEPECNEKLDLEGLTDAVYNKGAGTAIGEKKKPAKGCDDCEEDCVQVTGSLKVPYKVATTVSLPTVPDDLRPCQKQRVATAITTKLAPHEQKHVAAFKTFDGSPLLPINYKGCEGGYNSYLEGLAETEFERRKTNADAKSAKLDPFVVDVDLCCKDAKPKK